MKKLLSVISIIFLLIPFQSFAIIIGGGGGSSFCTSKDFRSDDNIFQEYQNHEYINGFLNIYFKLQVSETSQNGFYPFVNLYDSDCNRYGSDYYDDNNPPTIDFPAHMINFSLKFVNATHFVIWNDDENEKINCPLCDIEFSSYGYPNDLQASFYIGDYFGNNRISSGSLPILDPNLQKNKTPILIIPGVLGTNIYKGDNLLWANTKMATGFDGFMDPLGFNTNLTPIDNSLVATDVIRKMIFNAGISKFKVYDYTDSLINQLISSNFGYTEGKDLFTFPYDWRYGVATSTVEQLRGQIDYILNQTDAGKAAGKVDIVAHSTGGLLVKKYVMNNPANHHIGKAVFVGVPNLGAPKALKNLIEGDDFGIFNLDPQEMKKIGKNMPVIYDLAPTQEYYSQAGSFFHIYNPLSNPIENKDLNLTETMQNLVNGNYANEKAVSNSVNLHSIDFDNYDLRNEGIDLYNIVGCKSGTFGSISEWVTKNSSPKFDFPKVISGDGTVPFVSADSLTVDATKTFFVPEVAHSSLLSANGSRQQIVNILTGGALSTNGKVLTRSEVFNRPDLCEIKGDSLKIHSPLAVDIIDQDGNHSGPLEDGSIENSIPGADYEVWGEHKYVFLPTDEGQQYSIKLAGTGNGTFTLDDQSIDGNNISGTQVFSNLSVTSDLTGQVNLGGNNGQTTLILKATPTSAPITVLPSSVLDAEQSLDLISPVSTSTISGLMGQDGFYRSNATITLTALDPATLGKENETSGILKIQYSLDGQATSTYSTSSPLSITDEGPHNLTFFATDRAGNNEQPQAVDFVIDKTPPEFSIQFDPVLRDLVFTATDTLPSIVMATSTNLKVKMPKIPALKFVDSDNIITATDAAGNITKLTLKNKDRKHQLKADIQALSYNGKNQDISKTIFHFDWLYDKKNNIQVLTQQLQSKNNYNILSVYGLNRTLIIGKDQTGKVNKLLKGLILLKVSTDKGDFNWSY